MIVWLASYPRSGNTLLRTVLHQTLGCTSYSDEVDPEVRMRVGMTDESASEYGRRELPEPWERFYAGASASGEAVFVKTHRPPRDAQPAIYVVRDGRATLASYERFHRRFHGERARSLLELVLGIDYYGDWSSHHARWTRKEGPILVLKYEDLVDASPELLARLARFIGRSDPGPWRNPFARLSEHDPDFFVSGRKKWEGEPPWSASVDGIFFELHGDLMRELGYASPAEVEAARSRLGEMERSLARIAAGAASHAESLEAVCRERQAVIEDLHRACEERLEAIRRLDAELRAMGARENAAPTR